MRSAIVFYNREPAARLTEESRDCYVFRYDDAWLLDKTKPAVSLTLPKRQQEYRSESLFPFFFNMLSEGSNKALQTRQWRLDEADSFGLLLATAQVDTIGAVTVKPTNEPSDV
ncbi:MAG: HipA N-terminal domain-containing protein [Saprospiraceae bacterium]